MGSGRVLDEEPAGLELHVLPIGVGQKILLWDMTHPLMSLTTQGLADAVCETVWRNLTLAEWQQFVGEDIPYQRTCPNLPEHSSVAAGG